MTVAATAISKAEHRADMHSVAQERRKAGKPIWDSRIDLRDVFHDSDRTFHERRDAIVTRIKTSPWYTSKDEYSDLHEIVANLAEAPDAEEFDGWWNDLYTEADWDRVWIATV